MKVNCIMDKEDLNNIALTKISKEVLLKIKEEFNSGIVDLVFYKIQWPTFNEIEDYIKVSVKDSIFIKLIDIAAGKLE